MAEIRQNGKVEDAVKATIDSRGEKLSIAMMKAWFEMRIWMTINPVEKLLAHGGYLGSSVDIEDQPSVLMLFYSEEKCCFDGGVLPPVIKGELVLLGRNGSDYSAACLAACLNAGVCEIWMVWMVFILVIRVWCRMPYCCLACLTVKPWSFPISVRK